MPKGNKKIATGSEWFHYECSCSYTFDTADNKSIKKIISLHKKYCKIANNNEMMLSTGLKRDITESKTATLSHNADLLKNLKL